MRQFSTALQSLKVLLIRSPREKESGLAKLYIPGIPLKPFSESEKLILSWDSSSEPISTYNLCSKSQDYLSEEDEERSDKNPPQRGDVIAYLAKRYDSQAASETETYASSVRGLVSSNYNNPALFAEAEDRRLPAYVLKDGLLDLRKPDGTFEPAKFSRDIISFDKRDRSPQEEQELTEHLRHNYETIVTQRAQQYSWSRYLSFQSSSKKNILTAVTAMIEGDTHRKALEINPAYKKEWDDESSKISETKVEAPVVETPNPILQQNDDKIAEARKAFYDENYDEISKYD